MAASENHNVIDFEQFTLSTIVENRNVRYELHLKKKRDEISLFDAIEMTISTLKSGAPFVKENERENLIQSLEEFNAFSSDYVKRNQSHYGPHADELAINASKEQGFLHSSRLIQALLLVRTLTQGTDKFRVKSGITVRGLQNDCAKKFDKLDVLDKGSFKTDISKAYFYEAYGEAVIPEGESLIIKNPDGAEFKIESGSLLRFKSLRHFGAKQSLSQKYVSLLCKAKAVHQDRYNLTLASLESVFDHTCEGFEGATRQSIIYGRVPLHWITKGDKSCAPPRKAIGQSD